MSRIGFGEFLIISLEIISRPSVMHEKNSSSRHVTKMGGGGGDYAEGRENTLSVTYPPPPPPWGQIRGVGGGGYAVTPAV